MRAGAHEFREPFRKAIGEYQSSGVIIVIFFSS